MSPRAILSAMPPPLPRPAICRGLVVVSNSPRDPDLLTLVSPIAGGALEERLESMPSDSVWCVARRDWSPAVVSCRAQPGWSPYVDSIPQYSPHQVPQL